MSSQRYSLPEERPVLGGSAWLRRGWRLLAALEIPPLAIYLWHGLNFNDWGWDFLGLLICTGFAIGLWQGLMARSVSSNHGVFHRFERPLGYWLSIALLFAGYLFVLVASFLAEKVTPIPR